MTLAYVANTMNQAVALVVAQQIKLDLGLSDAQLGFILGMSYMLFSAVASVPLGRAADLNPRNVVVGASLSLMGVATAITGFAQTFWSLIALRGVAGTGDAGVIPGAASMVGDYVPPARRPLALSFFIAGSSIGAFLSYLFLGLVAEHYGWRAAYFWVGVFGVFVGVLVVVRLPDRKPRQIRVGNGSFSLQEVTQLLRIRPYRQIVFAFIAAGLTSAASWSWISPVTQRVYGLSLAEAGALLGIGFGVAAVLGSISFGALAMRLRVRGPGAPIWAALGMQLATAVCFVGGLSTDSIVAMEALIIGALFFAGPLVVIVLDTIQEVVPSETRGLGVGVALFLFCLLGQGLGPLVTGAATDLLRHYYGENALRLVMQCAMGVGSVWICAHLALAAGSLTASSRSAVIAV